MKEVIEIIEKLRELSGNEQLDYLKSHKNNEVLKEVLQYTYDTNKIYNINEAKLDKALKSIIITADIKESDYTVIDVNIWNEYKKSLDELASKKGVKEADVVRLCSRFLIHREQKSKELLRGILLKDLRINMGVVSFNKVWQDFCFKFPYLGARPFKMENLEKIKMPCYAQLKADGLFCNMIVDPFKKTVEYVSRQGKPIGIQGSLDESLLKIKASEKFVLTGEILVWDNATNKPKPREISNGIIRRDNKTQEELDSIRTMIWDCIPYKDFVKAKWSIPYSTRFEVLKNMISMSDNKLILIKTYIVNSVEEALKLFNEVYAKGEEGLVVKEFDLIWENKKPKGCVKIKNEDTCDLRAFAFEEGSGAYFGMCGTIFCRSEDGELEVGVKPRTPQQALDVWNNKDKYMGQILTVKYNAKIKDKRKVTWSLFLPVFVEWRIGEKDVADRSEDIK